MQLPIKSSYFNKKDVENILKRENRYITDLLSVLPLPNLIPEEDGILSDDSSSKVKRLLPINPDKNKTSRATSLVELQKRLDEISVRKRLNYKEKLIKKGIKNRIKRKGKQSERRAVQKQERLKTSDVELKIEEEPKEVVAQPSNDSEKMVFSKFDFATLGKRKHKKEKFDPQKTLEDLQKQKERLEKLRESGDVEKAAEIKEKSAWKSALAKAQGAKVRDDPELLTKSIKKREQQIKKSKKKWEARQEGVRKSQEERQQKRQDNIDKRKKEKKLTKIKQSVKRGKIVPGF